MTDSRHALTPDVDEFSEAVYAQVMQVMGVRHPSLASHSLSLIFKYPVRRVSQIVVQVDRDTASSGWSAATRNVLNRYIPQVRLSGEREIPSVGPLLVVSNHPAAYDFVILSKALRRDDLKILASDVPIVKMLPNTAQHFIPVPYDIPARLQTVRAVLQHLNGGGAVLIFPRGNIEPDPAVSPGAEQSLQGWSPSIELFLRRIPETLSIVAVASGMLSAKWYKNPLINLWKKYEQRQKVAEVFQIASQLFTGAKPDVNPMVTFSTPLTITALGGMDSPDGTLLSGLMEQAKLLLKLHPNVGIAR